MASRLISDLKNVCGVLCAKHLDAMKKEDIVFIVTCTYRSIEEQNELYKLGRKLGPKGFGKIVTNAKGGESAHNYALAYDIALIIGGKLDWRAEHPTWKRAVELGIECGLESLYPMESAHFQVPNWKKYIPKK